MRLVINRKIFYSTIVCLFLFSTIYGQTYRFRNFGTDSKLPNTFIYSIVQDNNEFLWIGTASGLVKFDGFDFYNVIFPDSVDNRYSAVSLKDKKGTLWFGCNDGTVFYARNNNLVEVKNLKTQSISHLFESADGYIYIVPQDKMILKINETKPDEVTRLYLSNDLVLTTASLTSSGQLLLGTQENLFLCGIKGDSVIIEKTIDGIEYSKVQAIHPLKKEGEFVIGTESNGLYKLSFPIINRY